MGRSLFWYLWFWGLETRSGNSSHTQRQTKVRIWRLNISTSEFISIIDTMRVWGGRLNSFDCCHFWLWRGFWAQHWLLLHLPAMITFHLLLRKSPNPPLNPIPRSNIWLEMVSDCHPPPAHLLHLSSEWLLKSSYMLYILNLVYFFLIVCRSIIFFHFRFFSFLTSSAPNLFSHLTTQSCLKVLIWNQFKQLKLHYFTK